MYKCYLFNKIKFKLISILKINSLGICSIEFQHTIRKVKNGSTFLCFLGENPGKIKSKCEFLEFVNCSSKYQYKYSK